MTSHPQSSDSSSLERLFGRSDLDPYWIAEPGLDLAPGIVDALANRASNAWYGYEIRSDALANSFWDWMSSRHGWERGELVTMVSPAAGSSIGTLINQHSEPGDGIIVCPPVFTDFKSIIKANHRELVKNPLELIDGTYQIDFDDLERKASEASNTMMILCSPHNPVGRAWTADELAKVAQICAANDVFVVADEIHADIVLGGAKFVPYATVAPAGSLWASIAGPIKTFGLAGVCDTLVITDSAEVAEKFEAFSSQVHLTRNNVFALAAFEAAYTTGGPWLDDTLSLIEKNAKTLTDGLPDGIELVEMTGTYLAWLDFRGLGIGVRELVDWLSGAGLAMSPGHWFGREGAGFARMTIAVPNNSVVAAVEAMNRAAATRAATTRAPENL